ncbi:hypothetical protein [Rubeoparvulum massiliense]|uniref:hypothetical protein n=1 Tax=Rubeoparvulum massiliense TaxID=1631346 RepID=UPI0012E0B8B3|nr:hypothetical protein [Rubeoparvulum massiliense]
MHILRVYEEEEMLGLVAFEADMAMSKDEWMEMLDHLYENPFMNRKFASLLTNRVPHSL